MYGVSVELTAPIAFHATAAMTMDFCRNLVDGISPTMAYNTGPMNVEWIEKKINSRAPVPQFAPLSFGGARARKPMVNSKVQESTMPVRYMVRRPKRAIRVQDRTVPKKPIAY